MDIKKAQWFDDGNKFNMTVPFAKIDEEKRTVSGFASLDNIDRHGDIVTSEASQKAFDRFRGNLREMHQPVAVGKVLSFKQQEFYDKETGSTYKGVFVTTYVSRGAQNTWEKVLDGTLTGFSIGGNVLESSDEYDKNIDKSVRKINDYELFELSLVDNPANPLANVFSIQKGVDGLIFKGDLATLKTVDVFWCKKDEIAITSNSTNTNCPVCNSEMESIGWVEDIESTKNVDVQKLVNSLNKNVTEGGTDMSDELAVESADIEENVDEIEEVTTEEVADETVDVLEKSDSADETVEETVEEDVLEKSADSHATEDLDIIKMLDELKAVVTDKVNASLEKADGTTQYVDQMLNTIKKSIDELAGNHATMAKNYDAMAKSHDEMAKNIQNLNGRMDAYEASTAVKKSSDLDGSVEEVRVLQKSIWNGHFLNVQDL